MTKRLAASANQVHFNGSRYWLAEEATMAVGGNTRPAAIVLFDSEADRDAWLAKPLHRSHSELQLGIERVLSEFDHRLDPGALLDLRMALMRLTAVIL